MRLFPRFALFALVVLVAVGIFLRSAKDPQLTRLFDLPGLGEDGLPELLQRIRDFHRVVTRRGEKILEISAREARYFRNRSAVEILEPKLLFFHEGKLVGSIEADKGSLVIDDAQLTSADMEGSVRLTLTKFSISADSMRYDRRAEEIHAHGATEIIAPEIALSGRDFLFDLRQHKLRVQSGVSMKLRRVSEVGPAGEQPGRRDG